MPGLALPNHDAANNVSEFRDPRTADNTTLSTDQLSPNKQLTPEESLALYCEPVELYNILRKRARKNPRSLERCLRYKIEEKRRKRIRITISLSESTNKQAQCIFPVHILLARPTSDALLGHSPIYRFSQVHLLTSFSNSGNSDHNKATLTIPDLNTLATSLACNLDIILIICGQDGQNFGESCSENNLDFSSPQKLGGTCFWGKIPIDLLRSSLENCVDLGLGRAVELASKITMSPSFIEPQFLEHESCLIFCARKADSAGSYELQVSIDAQEAGASDIHKSLYSCYSYDDVPRSILSDIVRLRTGNVCYYYKYSKNMHKEEVTEDFSCAICLVKCGSFKGLKCHLCTSHDLFQFEFMVCKDRQTVHVSLKNDTRATEIQDPKGVDRIINQIFSYRSRFRKGRKLETTTKKIEHVHLHITKSGAPENIEHVHALATESGSPKDTPERSVVNYAPRENGISVTQASGDSAHLFHGTDQSPPRVLQFGKSRKLSAYRDDPRIRLLLRKREFFHSHKAQKLELEEILADDDSEDEVDDDIADLEDRRMLDLFVDVTKDEKRIMHMWNSFVRRQRVLIDGHIPWACEEFCRCHGQELAHNPGLLGAWRLFTIKLWNHNLIDACTMNTGNIILDDFKRESSIPKI